MENMWVVLTLVLLVMKIAGLTTIGWFWVFTPLWLPYVLFIIGVIAFGWFVN